MKSPNEIAEELKLGRFKSRAQMLQFMVKKRAEREGAEYIQFWEDFKAEIGVKTTTALTDEKLDELIFAEYELLKKSET